MATPDAFLEDSLDLCFSQRSLASSRTRMRSTAFGFPIEGLLPLRFGQRLTDVEAAFCWQLSRYLRRHRRIWCAWSLAVFRYRSIIVSRVRFRIPFGIFVGQLCQRN